MIINSGAAEEFVAPQSARKGNRMIQTIANPATSCKAFLSCFMASLHGPAYPDSTDLLVPQGKEGQPCWLR